MNVSMYFVKKLSSDVYERGLGLFSYTEDILDIQPGLNHMMRSLNRLYKSPAREIAEYPLSIRTPDGVDEAEGIGCYEIIYRDITHIGYRMCVPDRIAEPEVFAAFKVILKEKMDMVHDAGVLHVDLYASNIMYCRHQDGSIDIKIVDWDVSHCLDEGIFYPRVASKLQDHLKKENIPFGREHDAMYLAVYDQDVADDSVEMWGNLASGCKDKVDKSFNYLLRRMLSPQL